MKMFLTIMAGDNAVDAKPILASSSPEIIDAVVGRLGLMVDDAAHDARQGSVEAQEIISAPPRPDAGAEVQA